MESKISFALGTDVTFVYPDYTTVLIGVFRYGKMLSALPSKIIAERCKDRLKEIKVCSTVLHMDTKTWH